MSFAGALIGSARGFALRVGAGVVFMLVLRRGFAMWPNRLRVAQEILDVATVRARCAGTGLRMASRPKRQPAVAVPVRRPSSVLLIFVG